MPSKKVLITAIAADEAEWITQAPENLMNFLSTAGMNYKYPFRDQLLIHAQKPDATACAELDQWNRMGRWVNKGTRGIALLVDRGSNFSLRYVFDVSNTNSRRGSNVYLWQMKPEYFEQSAEALIAAFGQTDDFSSFTDVIADAADIATFDNLGDYLEQIIDASKGSQIETLSPEEIMQMSCNLISKCVSYMVMTRCGIDTEMHFKAADFTDIRLFDTPQTIALFGSAASDISEMMLREIEGTVKSLDKENRTFANNAVRHYDTGDTKGSDKERRTDHETELYDAGRLPSSAAGSSADAGHREVRNDEEELPEGTQGRDLHRDASFREAQLPSSGSGQISPRDDGESDERTGEESRDNREPESTGSDEVGQDDELGEESGGGDRSERTDLQLTSLPTEEEQREMITQAESEKASAFVISQEDIDAVLTRGSGIYDGKFRIYEQYLKQRTPEENISFLKNEYGTGGAYPAVPGKALDESHDSKGLLISRERITDPDAKVLLKWNAVEKRISLNSSCLTRLWFMGNYRSPFVSRFFHCSSV